MPGWRTSATGSRGRPGVLANCATYMIFDDHEVTDDWFLNASWMNRVRASPFGRNGVRNGVIAYVAFQGWGNHPARFARHLARQPEPRAADPDHRRLRRGGAVPGLRARHRHGQPAGRHWQVIYRQTTEPATQDEVVLIARIIHRSDLERAVQQL